MTLSEFTEPARNAHCRMQPHAKSITSVKVGIKTAVVRFTENLTHVKDGELDEYEGEAPCPLVARAPSQCQDGRGQKHGREHRADKPFIETGRRRCPENLQQGGGKGESSKSSGVKAPKDVQGDA